MCALDAVKIVGEGRCRGSWHIGVGVVIYQPCGGVAVDERVVDEPVDRAALAAGVAEGVPRRQQVRMFLMELVFETTKGALADDERLIAAAPRRRRAG
jgi:hypothetical protein